MPGLERAGAYLTKAAQNYPHLQPLPNFVPLYHLYNVRFSVNAQMVVYSTTSPYNQKKINILKHCLFLQLKMHGQIMGQFTTDFVENLPGYHLYPN